MTTKPTDAEHICLQVRPRDPDDIRGILLDLVVLGNAVVRLEKPKPRKRKGAKS